MEHGYFFQLLSSPSHSETLFLSRPHQMHPSPGKNCTTIWFTPERKLFPIADEQKKNFIKIFVNKQARSLLIPIPGSNLIHNKFSCSFYGRSKTFQLSWARCAYFWAHITNTNFLRSLFLLELRARILGPSDIFVKSGSEIIMTCVIQQGPHDLGTVFWYKGKWAGNTAPGESCS